MAAGDDGGRTRTDADGKLPFPIAFPPPSRPFALSPAARPRLYGRKIKQILFKQEISCESERSLLSPSLSPPDPSNAPQTSKVQFVLFTSIASDFSVKEKAGEEQEAERERITFYWKNIAARLKMES